LTHRILVLEGLAPAALAVLQDAGFTVDQQEKPPSPDELAAAISPYDAILVRTYTRVTAAVLQAAPHLRVIGRPGVGVDNIDVETATRAGVLVVNSPGGNTLSAAELTLGLMLAVARTIPQADAALKAERWDRKAFAGIELSGKRLGIVGFGRVGRAVSVRCRAMGMDVATCDPYVDGETAARFGVPLVPLNELLGAADVVTLHCSLTDETRQMMDAHAFAAMKPGVRFLNAARGELVVEAALLEALESGRVAGAGLDVHACEPPLEWRLARHPRVVATPHVGGATPEAQERVAMDVVVAVRDFLLRGVVQNAVNPRSLYGSDRDKLR
jgi:D-3-phosphoglycerate dehydrogenase